MGTLNKIVLVAGLIPYDSGKTWFTTAVGLATNSKGLKVGVFKPVAGHNLWYSPRTFKASIRLGLLVGNDILEYYKRGLAENPALSNPIAIATLPPDPTSYDDLGTYFSEFETVGSTAALTRVYDCRRGRIDHYIHIENTARMSPTCREIAYKLQRALKAVPKAFSDIASYLMSPGVEDDLDECLAKVSAGKDIVYIEGFNDAVVAYPRLLEKSSLLVIVAPGRVLVYDDVYSITRIVKESFEKHGVEGLRARYVAEALKPKYSFETGLAFSPKPRRVHFDFVEKIIAELLRS